jgi:hypothetical protein
MCRKLQTTNYKLQTTNEKQQTTNNKQPKMYILKETGKPFTAIKGGKDDLLHKGEKDLLRELSVQLNIIHGGQTKPGSNQIWK